MNQRFVRTAITGLLLAIASTPMAGANPITIHSRATVSPGQVILDVFADTNGTALLSFGITVVYDTASLEFVSGGRYPGLWFLRSADGVSHAYTDLTLPAPGMVRVIGGRLDGAHPGEGVSGSHLLLATLVFNRLTNVDPSFDIMLASPPPYANFVAVDGGELDPAVDIQEPVIVPASEDTDNDGLPDNYEMDTFGDLVTSDGTSDTDNDGDDDHSEMMAGTDPTDPNSKFVVLLIYQPDGSKIALWDGKVDRVYEVEWSPDLASPFEVIATGIPGAGMPLEHPDLLHNGDPFGFYRLLSDYPTSGR